MTTYYQLVLNTKSPYKFKPTLDGVSYNCSVTWSLYGQRSMLNIFNLSNSLVASVPLVGTPDASPVAVATYDSFANEVRLDFGAPHGFPIGTVVTANVFGFVPTGYNGVFQLQSVTDTEMTYQTTYLDDATTQGLISQDLNLIDGYFNTSRMIFRTSTQQFEVTP